MSWKDLLQKPEVAVLPWIGGRVIRRGGRSWAYEGRLPSDHGWYSFDLVGRKAHFALQADPDMSVLKWAVRGYVVGDRIISDNSSPDPDPSRIADYSERVWLLDPGIDRFARVSAGRVCEDGPLVFSSVEMPLGPEDDVLRAYQDRMPGIMKVSGVTPALDAAFRMESWRRGEIERARAEVARILAEEEAKLAEAERRQKLMETVGSAVGRRRMAVVDFGEAARAAFAVGGAEYLDHRPMGFRNEMAVTFRVNGRRFECICDSGTLQIVDAGICLQDHRTGRRDDKLLTLESLPSVIIEADREGKLVVFRNVDDQFEDRDGDDDW